MDKLEIRRQLAHLLYGPILIALYHYNLLTLEILLGIIIGGAITSAVMKRRHMGPIRWVLSHFERDHHMENFPGRGILFFTVGAFLVLALFPQEIAYAGILILSFGDATSNLIGKHYGTVKTRLNPNKYIEGTLFGIVISFPFAYYFFPNVLAAISAACVAMFLEMPRIKIFGFEIDDNLIVPLAASFTLNLFW